MFVYDCTQFPSHMYSCHTISMIIKIHSYAALCTFNTSMFYTSAYPAISLVPTSTCALKAAINIGTISIYITVISVESALINICQQISKRILMNQYVNHIASVN